MKWDAELCRREIGIEVIESFAEGSRTSLSFSHELGHAAPPDGDQ